MPSGFPSGFGEFLRQLLSGGGGAADEADDAARSPLGEGTVVGRYVIEERLGQGGMGVVYRARDTELHRPVALKFLPPHLTEDPAAGERLLVEARAAARLDHPNVCTIHEIGTLDDGRSYIAMACYDGETLTERLARDGMLGPAAAADICVQVARGVGRAHEAGIVHRDLKPANIFITADGIVKVLDFGIAKMAGVDLTSEGQALGTIAYMSPEQIEGREVDARSDLWSLGVVLFEMCTGDRPFIGADRIAMLRAILELDPPHLTEMLPGFPRPLADVVTRCLAKDPAGRPPDAESLVEALEVALPAGDAAAEGRSDPEIGSGAAAAERTGWRDAAGESGETALSSEGERRQVTILTAELTGRRILEESLAPGAADELLESCRRTIEEVVAAHGGVINRNSGERLEALFGVPSAHEDDALRGARAGRRLASEIARVVAGAGGTEAIGMGLGLDAGRAVVRPHDAGRRYRVAGRPAERSARLSALAESGEVLVSAECLRLLEPFFEAERAAELPGRGGESATTAFRILGETGARSRLEAAAGGQGLTALAGRDAELAALDRAAESAREGQGRFASIVGEAGVGKSRLLHEFSRGLDDRFDVVRGRCQASGTDVPYLPFVEALRDRLGLTDDAEPETPELVRERVARISSELVPFVPFYLQLLSVDAGTGELQEALVGEQLRVGLVESLSAIFTLAAQRTPTALLFEDWHWADGASRLALRQLLEMVPAYPLLIVVTARPEGELGWEPSEIHTPISPGPLSPEDSKIIISSSLAADEVPPDLARLLHDRTGGNPFFLEEVCRALSEEGALRVDDGRASLAGSLDRLELPDTVQGVLRTRLDRLDESARRVVRFASVIGREFGRDVLERALPDESDLDEGLQRLRDLGLVQQVRVVPTPVYRFKHALTQEVAYDGLLERQRAEIHGAVGEALEAIGMERRDERLDRLAGHFAQAGRWEKAVEYAVQATDRLWAFSEFGEALEVQTRALDWTARLDDPAERARRRIELLLRQERLFEYLGARDRQQEVIDELLETLDEERDAAKIVETWVRQGDLCILTRDHAGAERALERAIRLSEKTDDPRLERNALRSMGLLRWHQDRHEDAIELVERALELDRSQDNLEAVIGDLANLGQLHRALGRSARALEYLEEALALERATRDRDLSKLVIKESYILHLIGSIYSAAGEHEKAREYLEAASQATAPDGKTMNVVQQHFHLTALARLDIQEGRVDDALERYRESVRLCRQTRHLEGLSMSLRLLGEVLLNLQRHDEALPILEEAAELYGKMRDDRSLADLTRGVAVALEGVGQDSDALDAWRRTRRLAEKLGDRSRLLEALEGEARCSRHTDPAGALRCLEEALDLAESDGDRRRSGSLRYATGLAHWESGRFEAALSSFEASHRDLTDAGAVEDAGLALNSVGRTLRDLGRHEEATERLETAIAFNRNHGERLLEAHALTTLGDVLLDTDDPAGAIERFETALEVRRELDDPQGRGWLLHRLARAHLARGSADGARYYLEEAAEIASGVDEVELRRACEALRDELTP